MTQKKMRGRARRGVSVSVIKAGPAIFDGRYFSKVEFDFDKIMAYGTFSPACDSYPLSAKRFLTRLWGCYPLMGLA